MRCIVVGTVAVLAAGNARSETIPVIAPRDGLAGVVAGELSRALVSVWTDCVFPVADAATADGRAIRLALDPGLEPEAWAVRPGQGGVVMAAGGPLGLSHAVHATLERIGFGSYLTADAAPAPRPGAPDFAAWGSSDAPLAKERIVFNWHNFLSGCTAWNFDDWALWIDQSRKMRFNTVMIHSYGNNPMFTFTHHGVAKPVGFMASTARGRDWGTAHVNDVRRLAGGAIFPGSVFGADAALAPLERRAKETQELMKRVIAHARASGMHFCFALDLDTAASNPQEVIRALPESARFRLSDGTTWLARPDVPEGYAYYRAQAKALFDLYSQIDRLAIWVRGGHTTWTDLKEEDLPPDWRAELAARAKADPAVAKLAQGPGRLGLGKVTEAFQRALKEIGRDDVRVWMGSWNFSWMDWADPWTPEGIPFVPLDWDVVHDQSHLNTPDKRAAIRAVAARRPVIPIVWAHHDDGQYIGRSYRPYDDFWTRLTDCGADSFGIIHWTTRPLNLYFKSLAEQTWASTSNRPVRATCDDMAERLFGPAARATGGEYLFAWINEAPIFGRDTSDHFIDRPFPLERVEATVAGCDNRLEILARIEPAALPPAGRTQLDYFRLFEKFCIAFFEGEGRHQAAVALAQKGDRDGARRQLEPVRPADVMDQYARMSSIGGITRGELGMLVTMNLKWSTYIESLRQALGLAPVRMSFGPTLHEVAAQGAGTLSFHVGPDSALWRVFGAKETGAAEFAMPGPVPAGAPAGWEELAGRGVMSTGALSFTVQPILDPQQGGPIPLEAGRHRLRLLFADPDATAPGQRVFDVTVRAVAQAETAVTIPAAARSATQTAEVDIVRDAGGPRRVFVKEFEVVLDAPGTVQVTLTPKKGAAVISAAVLEPVAGAPGDLKRREIEDGVSSTEAFQMQGFHWKSDVPEDCPFEPSPTLTGIYFTGRHSDYRCGDTFYPSWASDGNLYSPWTDGKMTSYILEADTITGPWRMVAYLKDFGEQAYFLNFPSKFISPDGRTLWLCYSANFSRGWNGVELKFNPPGGRYGLCLHEIKLLGPEEKPWKRAFLLLGKVSSLAS